MQAQTHMLCLIPLVLTHTRTWTIRTDSWNLRTQTCTLRSKTLVHKKEQTRAMYTPTSLLSVHEFGYNTNKKRRHSPGRRPLCLARVYKYIHLNTYIHTYIHMYVHTCIHTRSTGSRASCSSGCCVSSTSWPLPSPSVSALLAYLQVCQRAKALSVCQHVNTSTCQHADKSTVSMSTHQHVSMLISQLSACQHINMSACW
jgi:hypothetical protein